MTISQPVTCGCDAEVIRKFGDEARAVKIFETPRDAIDAIPLSLIKETEELREAWPELFETTLVHGVQVVGFGQDLWR